MKHLSVVKFVMVISGIWRLPLTSLSQTQQKLYGIYSVVIQSYMFGFVTCSIIGIFFVLNEEIDKVIENLSITITDIIIMIKLYICQKQKFRNLFAYVLHIEDQLTDMGSEDIEVYRLNAVHNKYMNLYLLIHSFICGLTLISSKFLSYVHLKNTAVRENWNVTKIEPPLLFCIWRPIDEEKHHYYALILDFVAATISCTCNIVTQQIFISIMTFLIGQLRILQNRFRTFGKESSETKTTEEDSEALRLLILEHKQIIMCVSIFVPFFQIPFVIYNY
ncbi:hypothetical protein JTB14_014056 [Gonioctena quinquepunctata]|nr:hypothetical protein JTB14_014056 [Gonioctena quinquepunctata]